MRFISFHYIFKINLACTVILRRPQLRTTYASTQTRPYTYGLKRTKHFYILIVNIYKMPIEVHVILRTIITR